MRKRNERARGERILEEKKTFKDNLENGGSTNILYTPVNRYIDVTSLLDHEKRTFN